MITSHALSRHGPDFFSISFLQSRPIALLGDVPRTMGALVRGGFEPYPLDYFYDTQLEHRKHIARAKLDGVRLSFTDFAGKESSAAGTLHILVWSVGFVVFRMTFNDEGVMRPSRDFRTWFRSMHALEHDLEPGIGPAQTWTAEFGGCTLRARGGVRRFFDLVAYAMHEHLCARRIFADELSLTVSTMESSIRYAENLVTKRELRFSYATTYGSHSEMIWSSPDTLPRNQENWIPALLGSGIEGERIATDVDDNIPGKWWYLSEFQSIVVAASQTVTPTRGVHDITRASMLEYIVYRRGGLTTIQRETYGVTAERRAVAKAQVADWMWLLSAVTNDYVLGGWSSTLFESVRRKFLASDGLRNIFDLEAQVSKNIDAFQGRLDAESDRMGVVTGVLFGIVAATALVPIGQVIIAYAFRLHGTYSNFPDNYPLPFAGIMMAMIVIVGTLSWGLLRRTRSLRPPRGGLGWLIRRGGRRA